MRFSIFYEHQLPRPWDDDSEHRLIKDALQQVQLADRLGYHGIWAVEHHFLEEYSHSSASDVFLAACAATTRNLRLGFGILPLPPGYQHPARVAETVATLDLISDGRVELGTGETSSGAELGGFGVDRATKRAQWSEALDVVARMMVEEPFAGHEGRWLSIPPRNVVPKPLQRPHPPLWVACSRRDTIRLAAEKGLGALSFSFVEPEDAKAWVDEYYDIIGSERCEPAGFAVNPNVAVALPMMVHADEAEAIERGIDGAHFFGYALAHYYVFGDHRPGETSIWQEFQQRRDDVGYARGIIKADQAPLGVRILQEGLGSLRGAIGTPDQVRDLVRRYEEAGVDELIFVMQSGKTRHEHICEALDLFAEEVMPEFAERREEREADKARRLAGAAQRALMRRERPREVDPDYRIAPQDAGETSPGVPARPAPATARRRRSGRGRALQRRLVKLRRAAEVRGERAFQSFVARADDRRLERAFRFPPAQAVLFRAMELRYVPEKAYGFTGDIQYDLRVADGEVRSWTVKITPASASARPGASSAAKLTITLSLADFLRVAAGELDPGRALLTGKLDLRGDFALATRLGEMFGQASPF